MPGGNRTGPEGYGSRTGRGLGYCSGYKSPIFAKGTSRGGFGRGIGRGLGRGFWGHNRGFWRREQHQDPYYGPAPYNQDTYPKPSKDEEKVYLESMIKGLEGELKAIKERLQELSK